ncbi:PspC domain-containing protein [Chitinophagaceae bacterium LB-8]|uniref:PspC domain-containing protein n=1 Tax=Paraflavisolibacter caeni TaxID=2982496 RepID=A0A9X2Y129_9BACT|nr:PspC domain-containing protein [Paraflavisolibacter caeni]MCU7552781.1 PspC domain-containing protein [Paraflavisolibacter caeni]
MKRIININLSGRVIPIEDAAYDSLQRYIESLRRYFAAEEGRDEIINDIESRIAELMNDKINKGAAAVTEDDINEIIHSMGRVEDFEAADAAEGAASSDQASGSFTYTGAQQRFKGRLYRDSSDKILGGVCSGIANYMNVDPAIIRLLFAIITLGGFGFGFLLYIIAWIVLPARAGEGYVGKRLFRNPDDKVIGGVAGGLGAYFNKPSWAIRLIFAAPLVLSILASVFNGIFSPFGGFYFPDIFFSSFTGTFLLAYIILWIVLPEARSTFEKMEMRGEKVDVNSIWQNVQRGMSDFETRAKSWGEEVKSSAENLGRSAQQFADTRGRAFAAEVAQTARPAASGIGHAIGVLFKIFFLFIAGSIAFGLFVALMFLILGGLANPMKDFLLDGFWQNASAWGVLILFLGVPIVALITWIVRRGMKVRSQNRYLGWVFGSLWTLGWVSLIIFGASMATDFRSYRKTNQDIRLAQPALNKLLIRIDDPEVEYSGTFPWFDADGGGWDLTRDSLKMANIKLRIDKSLDSNYHVTVWRYSAGENRDEATRRAEKIVYSASSMDSTLVLGSGFGVSKEQKFRGQKVMVEIKVPVGKKIRFDRTVEDKLYPINITIRERGNWNRRDWDIDWDEDYRMDWKADTDYIMTTAGELEEAEKYTGSQVPGGVYEYNPERKVDSMRQKIEEKERQLEEERRKLEEMQNNIRPSKLSEPVKQKEASTVLMAIPFGPLVI